MLCKQICATLQLEHECQLIPFSLCASQVRLLLYKKQSGTQREKKHVLTLALMLVRQKSACKTSAGSSKILRWLTPLLGPNLDPKTGPKQRPKRRNENVIQFWTPFWGPYLDPKMGSAIGEFRCCPHMLCKQICATLQLEHECQLIPFSLCASQVRLLLSRSLYRSHVLTTFFGPCFRGHDEAGLLAFEALQGLPLTGTRIYIIRLLGSLSNASRLLRMC